MISFKRLKPGMLFRANNPKNKNYFYGLVLYKTDQNVQIIWLDILAKVTIEASETMKCWQYWTEMK